MHITTMARETIVVDVIVVDVIGGVVVVNLPQTMIFMYNSTALQYQRSRRCFLYQHVHHAHYNHGTGSVIVVVNLP